MEDITKKITPSILKLMELLEIPVEHKGITKLVEKLGISRGRLYSWNNRGRISAQGITQIEEKGYPRETWYIAPQASVYGENEHNIEESSALDREESYAETQEIEVSGETHSIELHSPPDNARITQAIAKLLDIMKSDDPILITAIERNLHAFQQAAIKNIEIERQARQIKKLETDYDNLRQEFDALKRLIGQDRIDPLPASQRKGVM